MAKFNAARKVPKKHPTSDIKTPKLPIEKLEKIQTVKKLVSHEALRTSKYHKKIESNIRKTINEDM